MGVSVKRVALVEKARFFDAVVLQRISLRIGQSGAIPAVVSPNV